jgi:protein TonB
MTQKQILRIRQRDRETVWFAALLAAGLHYLAIMWIRVPQVPPRVFDVPPPENLVVIHPAAPAETAARPLLAARPPALAADAPIERALGPDAVPPKLLELAATVVPQEARRARLRGVVTAEVVIGADGTPGHIRIRSGLNRSLDEAAIDAIRRSRFLPGTDRGQPVAAVLAVEVRYP